MKSEPVGLLAGIAVVVVSAASALHIGLETDVVETFIADGVIIVTALFQRAKVTPVG